MRLVVDTNVFVSGLISGKAAPGKILRAIREQKVLLPVSDPIVDEYLRVLNYPRIRKYPGITDEFIRDVSALLIHHTHRVEVHTSVSLSRDPDDNMFLEAAVDGKADMVVSGDKSDLLVLGDVEGIPIVTAAEAASQLVR